MKRTYFTTGRVVEVPPAPLSQALPFPFALGTAVGAANLLAQQAMTFEAWVYINDYANPPADAWVQGYNASDVTQTLILFGQGGGVNYSFFIDVCYETIRLHNYGNGQAERTVGFPVVKQQWTHVAVSYDLNAVDGYQLKFYLAGQLVMQRYMAMGLLPATMFSIGGLDLQREVAALNGRLDEVRVWGYARSAAQILASYQKHTRALIAAGELTAANCLAAYSFEEPSTAPQLLDSSGNARHLNLLFGAWQQQPVPSTAPLTTL